MRSQAQPVRYCFPALEPVVVTQGSSRTSGSKRGGWKRSHGPDTEALATGEKQIMPDLQPPRLPSTPPIKHKEERC